MSQLPQLFGHLDTANTLLISCHLHFADRVWKM